MKNNLRFNSLIEKFASIKEKYGDNYPIILYEPAIKCEENEALRGLIEKNTLIHVFTEFREALQFVQSLGISFILIVSKDFDEQAVLRNFGGLEHTFGRGMIDFEEEALLKDLFKEISDSIRRSFKVYVFYTLLDCVTEIDTKEDEEVMVMIMCDIKDIAKEFRQEFIIIWYDPNLSSERKQKLEEQIDTKIEENNIYTKSTDLYERIGSYSGVPYHLIMSGSDEAGEIMKEIENHQDLLSLYIYCKHFKMEEKIESEKVEIQKTLEELVPRIKEGIRTRSKLKNTFPAFATDFDASDRTGIFKLHYYLRGLINFKNRKQAKGDFVNLARKIYQDKEKELARFEEKYDEYNKEEILRWYTRESPIYRLINNCLRISSSDSILCCRFVLKDLERAIKEEYQEKSKDFSGAVYRGAFLSTDEWEKLERNIGQEIEMYGFLSTSVNQKIAVNFLRADSKNKILIKIIIPPLPELDEQGFADISEFSEHKGEKEILFNVRSKFRILEANISKIDRRGTQCRQLVLLYGAQSLRSYMTKHKPSIKVELELPPEVKCNLCGSKERLFGFQLDESSVNCLECLIKISIPKDTPLISLEGENKKRIERTLPGKIFASQEAGTFSNCGYKCHDCDNQKKEKYYKWMSCDGKDILVQCSECLEKKKTMRNSILLSEVTPYAMWQEQQKEWETVSNEYERFLSPRMSSENQGYVYREVQNYRLCIDYSKKAVDKLKNKRRKEEHKYFFYYLLGTAYELLGEYQESLKYLRKCQAMVKFVSGEKSRNAASLYSTLANVHWALSKYQEAKEYVHQALDVQKFVYGGKDPESALSYLGLARNYESLCQYEKAHENIKEALIIQKLVFGDKHPETARGYETLGRLYQSLGNYQAALHNCQIVFRIKESAYGEKHAETAISCGNLALAYYHLGNYQEAIELFHKALEIRTSISGEMHPHIGILCNNFALVFSAFGKSQEALEYLSKAFDICKSLYGERHSDTAQCFHNLGTVYHRRGDLKKAQECLLKAIDIRKSIFGENHAEVASSYLDIGAICNTLKEYQEALKYFQKALDIQRLIHGNHHPHFVVGYGNSALAFEGLGQYEKALELSFKAIDMSKVVYGEQHSKTATFYNNLGALYFSLGNNEKAIEYFQKTTKIKISNFGEKHPEVAITYSNIAEALKKLERYQEAIEYSSKALRIRNSLFEGNKPPDFQNIVPS